jgi:transposase-like protein
MGGKKMTNEESRAPRSWLLLTKDVHALQHGGNNGYSEVLGHNYRFDSTVANHGQLNIDDRIALWNGNLLLGISKIDKISKSPSVKSRFRCPTCGTTKIKLRRTLTPQYRCHSCYLEFDDPIRETLSVDEYLIDYSTQWRPFGGYVVSSEIRSLAISHKSQHSMRELDRERFDRFLERHNLGD